MMEAHRTADRAAHALGRSTAPLFATFSLFVRDRLAEGGINRLFCLAREGIFFQDLFRRSGRFEGIGIDILHVSRRSTFLPSLGDDELLTLGRLFSRYPAQTPVTLLSSLNLPLDRVSVIVKRLFGATWQDAIQSADATAALLADREFQDILSVARDEARALLIRHLGAQGMPVEDGRAVVLDIGWRGSIQEDLSQLLPRVSISGLYLHLVPGSDDSANPKEALFSGGQRPRAKPKRPLEMICNAPGGSCTGYTMEDGGGVVPVRSILEAEDRIWHAFTRHFQAGVLAALPDCLAGESDWRALRNSAMGVYDRLIREPDVVMMDAFFQLAHDERFGLGKVVGCHQLPSYGELLRAAVWPPATLPMFDRLRNSGWPQAVLARVLPHWQYRFVHGVGLTRYM